MRKPVAILNNHNGNTVCACDDGSVFVFLSADSGWIEAPAIPGTARAAELAKPADPAQLPLPCVDCGRVTEIAG